MCLAWAAVGVSTLGGVVVIELELNFFDWHPSYDLDLLPPAAAVVFDSPLVRPRDQLSQPWSTFDREVVRGWSFVLS